MKVASGSGGGHPPPPCAKWILAMVPALLCVVTDSTSSSFIPLGVLLQASGLIRAHHDDERVGAGHIDPASCLPPS